MVTIAIYNIIVVPTMIYHYVAVSNLLATISDNNGRSWLMMVVNSSN